MSDEERDNSNGQDLPTAGDLLRWAERTQRTIDFMIQQQAQFQTKSETDMQRLRELYEQNELRWSQNEERWARSDERWASADERWERTREQILALLALAEIHNAEINELRRTQAESQARADAKFVETGERVDALVNTVERLISERRNAGGKREESSG
jgi:crotonobetainyl-CoA:carnitine CoA-transferase CaiB-like acyl-CoA transferase